jgi:hypothetical protein
MTSQTDETSQTTSYSSQLLQRSYEIQGLRDTNLGEAHYSVFPNRLSGGWWEAPHPNQPSQVSSHHRHECEQTLNDRGTHTSPSPQWCRQRCHHHP